MAWELLAWVQRLALDGRARAWEPKLLRLHLLCVAGGMARTGRGLLECVCEGNQPGLSGPAAVYAMATSLVT